MSCDSTVRKATQRIQKKNTKEAVRSNLQARHLHEGNKVCHKSLWMDQNSEVAGTLNHGMLVSGYVLWDLDSGFIFSSFDLNGVVLLYVVGNILAAEDLLWNTYSFQNHPT